MARKALCEQRNDQKVKKREEKKVCVSFLGVDLEVVVVYPSSPGCVPLAGLLQHCCLASCLLSRSGHAAVLHHHPEIINTKRSEGRQQPGRAHKAELQGQKGLCDMWGAEQTQLSLI